MTTLGRCLVIGAGALGGPIALTLAAKGVPLRIVDDDTVELSNLPRQVQFRDNDIGTAKVVALRDRIARASEHRRDAEAAIEIEQVRFQTANARRLLADVALVIDASDSPATKFLSCDQALAHQLPYVIAAAIGEQGNLFIGAPAHACYRCLFEAPPPDAATCASVGVLAPICGIIAHLAADAALQILQESRASSYGSLLRANLGGDGPPWRAISLQRRADCACARPRVPLAIVANA